MTDTSIPLKCCSRKENCIHPDGPYLPATTEFFYKKTRAKDGLTSWCKKCQNQNSMEFQKKWNQENLDSIKESKKRYTRTLKGIKARERARERVRESDREKAKQYYRTHPEAALAKKHRRKARKCGLPNTLTGKQWQSCLEYHHYCCAVCGSQLRDLFGDVEPHADHWIPLAHPDCPGTVAENMVCLCNSCNLSKGSKSPDIWLKAKYSLNKAKEILERVSSYFAWVNDRS